jgi:hypothetical protein
MIWFPHTKNATQLESSHLLQPKDTKITWTNDSGHTPFMRRFFLTPVKNKAELLLNVAGEHKPATLIFSYNIGNIPATTSPPTSNTLEKKNIQVEISTFHDQHKKILSIHEITPSMEIEAPLKKIELPISKNVNIIKITFNHLVSGTGVWIYEFNLSDSDFPHSTSLLKRN